MSAPDRFGRIAQNFVTSEVHASSPTIDALHARLRGGRTDRVCDVACGAGHLALSFAGTAACIVGVDAAPRMVAAFARLAAERGVAAEAVAADVEALPFASGAFDVVTSRLAPHHFRDVRHAVRVLARVARPGGLVAVIDLEGHADAAIDAVNHRIELLHDPTHVRSYTAAEWQALFRASGLAIVTCESGHREFPAGLSVRRWCEIGASGLDAEQQIREVLRAARPETLDALGIATAGDEFLLAIRTVLVAGTRRGG